nr:unnamed protein product [Callosobruchus chinensis]
MTYSRKHLNRQRVIHRREKFLTLRMINAPGWCAFCVQEYPPRIKIRLPTGCTGRIGRGTLLALLLKLIRF